MTKLYVADRVAGNHIEEVTSIEEGIKLIDEYEKSDKEEGIFEYGFYEVLEVDGSEHRTVYSVASGIDER